MKQLEFTTKRSEFARGEKLLRAIRIGDGTLIFRNRETLYSGHEKTVTKLGYEIEGRYMKVIFDPQEEEIKRKVDIYSLFRELKFKGTEPNTKELARKILDLQRLVHDLRVTGVDMVSPGKTEGATFGNYDAKTETQEKARDGLLKLLDINLAEKPRIVVLHGDPGVGKTHLAVAFTKIIEADGEKTTKLFCRTIKKPQIKDQVWAHFDEVLKNGEGQTFDRDALFRPVILFDDISKETNLVPEFFRRHIEVRTDNEVPGLVLITTNLNPKEYRELIESWPGGATARSFWSRYDQYAHSIVIEGPDRRKEEKEQFF
jgi:DNA replication protein DnaC